jgi:hypothetical protein
MADLRQVADDAIEAANRLSRILKKVRQRQVRSEAERSLIRATAFAWFNTQRPLLLEHGTVDLTEIDPIYRLVLEATERSLTRSTYLGWIKDIKSKLISLRSKLLVAAPLSHKSTDDAAPNFGSLITDANMQQILLRRWNEACICIREKANLAAIVMMGALLEGLLLAKINQTPNKAPIFTSKAAPKDKNGTPLTLKDWGLKDYLDVAHELAWISRSAKDVGAVLRDYRNYIHPEKERSHGVQLSAEDVAVMWTVFKSISREIL